MPMSRYEIRNEYSLADPELYRVADRDDPEALLEGVAMAGLVGVLRQLGDLAEFAAEIFHDLHEEVLATAARGHSLMIRVQQFEAEVPSIRKAFLTQTDHFSFFNNAGVGRHPKLRMDQNLVTQGDLPRFVMDSYEECRGPPRLFLLDKFDVAGAGACLKRYTDPSFFKVETSTMTNADVHREKKHHKTKKRGQRWRNGGTPEVLPASHAKLHQHLLEEPVENGVSKPTCKLKRRPLFSPFDSKPGGIYMEKLLKSPSPEHQMLREITGSLPLRLFTNDRHESDLATKRSLPPDREKIMQNSLIYETNEVSEDDKICEVPSYLNIVTDGIPSTFDEVTGEKYITVDGESKAEGYLTGYQSDEVASEIDNYVDAPSIIESGMDTDSEFRVKDDFTSSSINSQQLVSVENKVHLYSLSSDSPRTSAENLHSQKISAEGIASADIPEIAIVHDASYYQKTADEFPVDQFPEHFIPTSDGEEKKINLISDFPCSPSVSDSNSQSGNDSLTSSAGEHLMDEPNCENAPRVSNVSDSVCHTKDSSAAISANFLHDEDYDHKDLNKLENTTSTLNICNVLSQNRIHNAEMIPTENSLPGELDDDVPNLTENFLSDYTDISHKGDNITSKLLREEKLNAKLDKDSDVHFDASNHSSCIMEASLAKELAETSLTKAETVDAEDHYSESSISNQINSETLISSPTENSLDFLEAGLDAHDRDFIPVEETTVNETPEVRNPKSCEVVGLPGTGITDYVTPNDFVAPESSCCTEENLENPIGTSGIAANDEIEPDKDFIGLEGTETSIHEDPKLPDEVHELLDESDSKIDQSETGVMASSAAAVFDNAIRESVDLPVSLDNSVKEHISCFDGSGLDELQNEKESLSECHRESGLVEKDNSYISECHTKSDLVEETSTSDLQTVFCSTVNNDHPILEVSHTVPNSYIDSACGSTQDHSPLEQSGLDTDQESFQKSGIENQVSDATSLSISCHTKETMLEKIELPHDQIDQEFPDSGERSSELSSLLPINHQQILDHHDHNVKCPPLVSGLPELRNYDIDISGYPKDPLDFIFPPSNPFSETNQINLDELPPLPPLPPVQWMMGKHQHASGEIMKHKELFPREISPSTASSGNISSSLEEMNHSLIPVVSEMKSKEEKTERSFSSFEATSIHETADLPPKIENENANESRKTKLPRPSRPLIESVAVLDKSKLRNVAERVRPQIQKVDERDPLLQQIMAKSFNLKPAVASRPSSIQGTQTNLKVAAILEKANAIRQAFAGSDDDEDNWSDS